MLPPIPHLTSLALSLRIAKNTDYLTRKATHERRQQPKN
nr:MAG TPA: hypothetical protein [Caudoviricetes sp.]